MSEKKDIANGTGFRWYWLLDYEMSDYVKQRYNCSWSRKEDNYFLYRREGKRIDDRGDFFIIIRTSEKCYRVSYFPCYRARANLRHSGGRATPRTL